MNPLTERLTAAKTTLKGALTGSFASTRIQRAIDILDEEIRVSQLLDFPIKTDTVIDEENPLHIGIISMMTALVAERYTIPPAELSDICSGDIMMLMTAEQTFCDVFALLIRKAESH